MRRLRRRGGRVSRRGGEAARRRGGEAARRRGGEAARAQRKQRRQTEARSMIMSLTPAPAHRPEARVALLGRSTCGWAGAGAGGVRPRGACARGSRQARDAENSLVEITKDVEVATTYTTCAQAGGSRQCRLVSARTEAGSRQCAAHLCATDESSVLRRWSRRLLRFDPHQNSCVNPVLHTGT
jgi:hypothetical protein